MADRLQLNSKASNHTTAEHFGSELQAEETFGVSIDTTGDLAAVQRAVLAWSEGICATSNKFLRPTGSLPRIHIWRIANGNLTGSNETLPMRSGLLGRSPGMEQLKTLGPGILVGISE